MVHFSLCLERNADEIRADILDWIAPGFMKMPFEDHHGIVEKRDPDTGRWFLDGREFDSWRQTGGPFIWLYGDGNPPFRRSNLS
jgi:hypothetical protein